MTDLVVRDGAEEVRVQAVPGHVLHHVLVRLIFGFMVISGGMG